MSDYNLDMLRESMVKILGSDGQTVSGSGFIIRSDGYLVTCHHVIYQLGLLKVEYRGQVYEAQWCEEFSHPDVDIAILKIDVVDAKAVAIINPQRLLTSVTVYGFPPKQEKFFPEGIDVFAKTIRSSAPVNTISTYRSREITANNPWNKLPQEKSTFKSHRINEKVEAGTSGGAVFAQELGGVVGVIQCSKSDESYVIRWDNITEILERLGLEPQKNAVANFLAEIEQQYKFIRLFHTAQEIVLQDQYIPIQVTLERKYRHEVESFWGYLESEAEAKRAYAFKGFDESRQVEVDWEKAREEHQKIMVLADPGMGKSTLLKMEALTTAKAEREKLFGNLGNIDEAIFPLAIRLSDLAETEAEIFDAIPRIIKRDYPKTSVLIDELLKEKLENGKCLLLLDALDEVPKAQRNRLAEKLNRFTRNYPCPIICTSRIVGYGGAFVEGAKEVEIVPFSQKQTEKYIQTWFNNAAGYINQDLCSGEQKPGFSVNENQLNTEVSQETGFFSAINNDAVSAEGLIGELGNKPQFQGLAQNPLLLSLLCSLYQEKELHLPARRSQVYQQAVDYMLRKWRGENKRQLCEDGWVIAKIGLLQDIAYHFSCDGKEIFSLQELSDRIDKFLHENRKSDFRDVKAAELIKELAEEDGILQKLDRDGDKYLFLHRTFQEYFAASYLLGKRIDLAKAHFWEYDWHETLSLLAGLMENPVPLVEAIMGEKDDIFRSLLLLAGKCIAECEDSEHPLFVEIIERIFRFWESYPRADFINSAVVTLGKVNSLMYGRLHDALNRNKNSDVIVIEKAAQVLGKIGHPQAVEALISALYHKDNFIVLSAIIALEGLANPKVVQGLISALKYEDSLIRYGAAKALGQLGNPQAVEALIEALKDEDTDLIFMVTSALGQLDNPQSAEILISVFKDENTANTHIFLIAIALQRRGYLKEMRPLISAVSNEYINVRKLAIEAFGKINHPQGIEALISALQDQDSDVKDEAAEALAKIIHSQGIEPLISVLQDQDSDVRRGAAKVLGQLGNPQGIEALISALEDQDSYVRREAAKALGTIGTSEILEKLIKFPHINILDPDIFPVARKLAVRFSKERRDLIPVYPEKAILPLIWAIVRLLFRIITQPIRRIQRYLSTRLTKRRHHPVP